MIRELTGRAFQESLHTRFRVCMDSVPETDLVLNEVVDRVSPGEERFAVYFRGDRETFLPQGTYRMEHDTLGSIEIFIVPVGGNPGGYTYEAVFHRLKD